MTQTYRHIRPQARGPARVVPWQLIAALALLVVGWSAVAWYAGQLVGWW